MDARALLDTGTTHTLVSPNLARRLKLVMAGLIPVRHATSDDPVICLTSEADIILVGEDRRAFTVPSFVILAPAEMDYDVIIGMNTLAGGILTVDLIDDVWEWRRPG